MKISIIVPVYNVEPYIKECLESIGSQKCNSDIECLIIDDKGSDNSIEIANSYINSYQGNIQFIIIHHDKNRGLSAARNTGIDNATGDYIIFVDSDDYLLPDSLSKFISIITIFPYEMVLGHHISNLYPTIETDVEEGPIHGENTIFHKHLSAIATRSYKSPWWFEAWNIMYKKSFLDRTNIRFIEGMINEDVPWKFEITRLCKSAFVFRSPTYYYRIRPDSIMRSMDKKKEIRNRINYLSKIIEICKTNSLINNNHVQHYLYAENDKTFRVLAEINESESQLFYKVLSTCKIRLIALVLNGFLPKKKIISRFFYYLPKPFSFWYWNLIYKSNISLK